MSALTNHPRAVVHASNAEGGAAAIGEIACIVTDGRPAEAADASALLSDALQLSAATWVDNRIALAWSGASEVEVADDLVVVVEGRLDNRRVLAERAGERACKSTAGILAALWRRHGERMVDLLIGEIAAIVVDRPASKAYALRDICSGRPLHIARLDSGWAIASEWRPLAFVDGNRSAPNPEWFAAAFLPQSIEPRATPYVGVEMVLPGYVAKPGAIGWNQVRCAQWHIPRLGDTRPGAYTEAFRAVFDEAVRCRIEAAGSSIAVCLSGGLDSTSVIATARAMRPEQRRIAVCMGMVEPKGDERALQRLVADQCADELRWADLTPHAPLGPDGPDSVFARFGAPPLSTNWFLQDALAAEAHRAGVGVVLSGEDGDGCLNANPSYLADLLIKGRWLRWLREVNVLRTRRQMGGRALLEESLYLAAPPLLRRAYIRGTRMELAPALLSERLRRDLDLEERLRRSPHNATWRPGRAFRLAQSEVGLTEQVGPVFTHIAQTWRQRSLLFSHPWNDRRLMSFCMGLPFNHVVADGVTKVVLRQAMSGRLPDAVLLRHTKSDISEAARNAARGPQVGFVTEGLKLAREREGWFDAATVDSIRSGFEAGESRTEGSALRVAMFASWLRWCGV